MAKPSLLHPVLPFSPPLICFFLLLLLSYSLLQLAAVVVAANRNYSPVNSTTIIPAGFSLEFIHSDSIFSPLFPGNLTSSQWFRRQVERSKSHVQGLQLSIMKTPKVTDLTPRPPVSYHDFTYMVMVSLGTPSLTYFLHLDIGSDVTWFQCLPCDPCYHQVNQIFDPKASSTYNVMTCEDPLCTPPFYECDVENNRCIFDVGYADGQSSEGDVARESFSFFSNIRGQQVVIPNIVFGCASKCTSNLFNNVMAGILGMGGGMTSFAVQFLGRQTDKRFSYCLIGWPAAMIMNSYLRFGNDIPEGNQAVQTIPIEPSQFPSVYHFKLLDISIDGIRVNMPAGIFEQHPDGSGGFIIDCGADLSYFQEEAYNIFRDSLDMYFMADNLEPAHPPPDTTHPTDLCYQIPDGFNRYPSISYHFQTAELRVVPQQLFFFDLEAKYFCLAIESNPHYNILGVMQQVNYRFTYDLGNQQLAFSPEDCSAESRH